MKKYTSIFLALTMAFTLLSGCGAEEQPAAVQVAPYAAPVSATVEAAPAPTEAPEEEGFRFFEPA
ncbi:MAG: hypothetical protein IJV64_10560, partial [Oscillospiraceae bacterium]|nr:hypothetical protein [Oscillospiraceae bacterium]